MNKFGYQDLLAEINALSPAAVHGQVNTTTTYYRIKLLNKIIGAFEVGELPETFDPYYFLPTLFGNGSITIFDSPVGLVALYGTPQGRDLYYQPQTMVVTNPIIGDYSLQVGKECALVRINPELFGMLPMINRYAELLASIDASINVNVINSRTAYFAQAEDKAEAEGLKRVIDEISRGLPAVFWRKKKKLVETPPLPFQHIPVKDSFVADLLMRLKSDVMEDFDRELGFSLIVKRERVINSELNQNTSEARNNIETMLYCIRQGFEDSNRLFGTNLSIKFKGEEGTQKNESDIIRSV